MLKPFCPCPSLIPTAAAPIGRRSGNGRGSCGAVQASASAIEVLTPVQINSATCAAGWNGKTALGRIALAGEGPGRYHPRHAGPPQTLPTHRQGPGPRGGAGYRWTFSCRKDAVDEPLSEILEPKA